MGEIVKYCKKCFKDPYKYAEHMCSITDLDINYIINEGSIGYYITSVDDEYCYYHPDEKMTISNLTAEEYNYMSIDMGAKLDFIYAMDKLKEKDIIEFQLKLSQFKTQTQQQESIKAQSDNIPKCPTCGSTKLSKVSVTSKAGSVFMFGLLSQKVKKTWHCDNCKYEW